MLALPSTSSVLPIPGLSNFELNVCVVFTLQAGWSIGFGALTEPDEWSMIYTM